MTRSRKPLWSVAALLLQVIALLCGYGAGSALGHPWSLDIFVYAVPVYGFLSLIGAAAAAIALLRHEPSVRFSCIGLALNIIPGFFMVFLIVTQLMGR